MNQKHWFNTWKRTVAIGDKRTDPVNREHNALPTPIEEMGRAISRCFIALLVLTDG